MKHTDLINKIISEKGYKRYLEIGTYDRSHNFDKVKCQWKFSVDPDPKANANFSGTSDEFFASNYQMFDFIFIDGLHHAEQVKKDFDSAMAMLSEDGCIMIHDTNPHSEHITHVPRDNGEWTGNVYKFACALNGYGGIDFYTWPEDYGCTVIWKDISMLGIAGEEITWEEFDKNRAELLRFKNVL